MNSYPKITIHKCRRYFLYSFLSNSNSNILFVFKISIHEGMPFAIDPLLIFMGFSCSYRTWLCEDTHILFTSFHIVIYSLLIRSNCSSFQRQLNFQRQTNFIQFPHLFISPFPPIPMSHAISVSLFFVGLIFL